MSTQSVSVIVPFYNAQSTLRACLESITKELSPDDELILVDDASADSSYSIAQDFPARKVQLSKNSGAAAARNKGVEEARNEILVFVDADTVLTGNNISEVKEYFKSHPEIQSLTATLDTKSGPRDFFSDYKNLYMNYIFLLCGQRVNFIYGSFCATRKNEFLPWPVNPSLGEDSHWGLLQTLKGMIIHLDHKIAVTHWKRYNLKLLAKNDFNIAKNFAILFLRYRRWGTIYTEEKFGHTSKSQKLSLLLAVAVTPLSLFSFNGGLILFVVWFYSNKDFFSFLKDQRGYRFALKSIAWTFVDHHIYFFGILSGLISHSRNK